MNHRTKSVTTWRLTEFEPVTLPAAALPPATGQTLWQQFDSGGRRLQVEFPGVPTEGQWRLTNLGYAGQIALPAGQVLQLQPKIPLHNLFRLIDIVYNLPGYTWLAGWAGCDTFDAYFDRLASFLAGAIEARRRLGLYQAYLERQAASRFVRGRLDLRRLAARPYAETVPCQFTEPTVDNLDNQILAGTLAQLLRSGLATPPTSQRLGRALRGLAGVQAPSISAAACLGRTYNRLNQDYALLHQLCALFLEGMGPAGFGGSQKLPAFLVNMAELFERAVYRWLATHLPRPYRLSGQEAVYLDEKGHYRFELDLVLRQGTAIEAVLDTKYKRPLSGPATADIAQVVAYAQAIGSSRAYLVYPTPLAKPLATRIGSVELRSLHFDLAQPLADAGASFLAQLDL